MQEEKIKKQYRKILIAIIAIIYMCVLVTVALKYINANRYWELNCYETNITAESGQDILVKARVKNKMYYVMGSKDDYFISYHLYSNAGNLIQYDNIRTNVEDINPGWAEDVKILVKTPIERGKYKIVIDVVKEDEYWFTDRGESPGVLYLFVE